MKRASCCIALVLAALLYLPPSALAGEDGAGQNYMAAGIALLARHAQSELIFLVRHHSRSWYEMPGGRRRLAGNADPGQGERSETAYETAIRECYEESRGFLLPEFLRGVVDPTRKLRDGEFVYFVATIEWFALAELSGEADAGHESTPAFNEIVDYAWVPVTNVINSEDGTVVDSNGRRLEVRRQLKPRLVLVRAAGWLQTK